MMNKNNVAEGNKRQLRSIVSQYSEYREKIWAQIIEGMKKPAAQVTLALVGTLILVTLLLVLALRPTLLTISGLIQQIDEEQRLVTALDVKIKSLQTAQQTLSGLGDQLRLLSAAIPNRHEFDIFVKEIELAAAETGLVSLEISQPGFKLVSKDDKPKKETVNKLQVLSAVLTVGGSESAIRQFIKEINRLDRIVVFHSIKLETKSWGQRFGNSYPVGATIRLDVFYRKAADV